MRTLFSYLGLISALSAIPADAFAIPYFARKYGFSCSKCHLAPPKLNEFGYRFVLRGYRPPEPVETKRTWPFALWVSGRMESLPDSSLSEAETFLNRVEVISGGPLTSWLTYFVEWRPVSRELRGDRTLRDRAGRFEDLFVALSAGRVEATAGQFRQVAQVDVSQRLELSEPLVLSASLPGSGGGTSRERGLRAFSPSGRSPAVRLAWNQPLGNMRRWITSVAVPVPGEFSIPLTDSAKVQASNEIEWRRKGVVVESFVRDGLFSVGGHGFYDNADRYLGNLLATYSVGDVHLTGMGGAARRTAPGGTGPDLFGQWSVQGEFIPSRFIAAGARLEDRAADGAGRALLPFFNAHFPGTRYTFRVTVEQRLQENRNMTIVELAAIF